LIINAGQLQSSSAFMALGILKDWIATTCQNSWLSFLLLKEIAENLWFCKDNSVKR